MFDFNDPNISVQMCKFQAFIEKAHVVIKFPCSYFVEWRTINNRYSICTQTRIRAANNQAIFNQKLTFYTEMVYNAKKREYYSKETFLVLNLVSKSRPDQVKLVGRISVDLADILNRKRYSQSTHVKLNYCSVEGSILFNVNLLSKRQSNLSVKDLDRSAFTDYFSLNPINRMIIEESITGTYAPSNRNMAKQQNKRTFQQENYENSNNVPTFAPVGQQNSAKQAKYQKQQGFTPHKQAQKAQIPKHSVQNQKYFNTIKQKDEEIISFNNEGKQEQISNFNEESRITQSREQSLIQKLEEKNFRFQQNQRLHKNIVEINAKQPKTQRQINIKLNKSSSKGQLLSKVNQDIQGGQIKKQNLSSQVQMKSPLQSLITLPKPTSPPSYEKTLNHQNSEGKFSEASQMQNQKLLSIVSKLQQQKIEQDSMIQSLKSMIVGKNMKKKEKSPIDDDLHRQKHQQLIQQNKMLRDQVKNLNIEYTAMDAQIRGKQKHIFQLLDKIKRLQNQISELHLRIQANNNQFVQKKQVQNGYQLEQLQNQFSLQKVKNQIDTFSNLQFPKLIQVVSQSSMTNQNADKTSYNLLNGLQNEGQYNIKITKDEKIYQELEVENEQLLQRVRELEEQNLAYRQLMNDHNTEASPIFQLRRLTGQKPQKSIGEPESEEEQSPFKILITKNNNIYENYQNLEQENTELYQRIKELQNQVQSYKQLMREESPPILHSQEQIQVHEGQQQLFSYPISINNIDEQNSQNQNNQSNELSLTKGLQMLLPINTMQNKANQSLAQQTVGLQQNHMNLFAETFKIILTKDKNIYKEQEQQNVQLSRRVIELQEEVQKYRELLRVQPSHAYENGQTNQYHSNSYNKFFQGKHESIQQTQNYQDAGFTITLTKDKNIFQNQEKQLSQLEIKIVQLEETVSKYKSLYGNLTQEPEYKISVTRDQRIYQDQQYEIRDLLKTIQTKDDEVIELMKRISILERQLEEVRPSGDNGQIKIFIRRDENIYETQQKQIVQLSDRVVELEEKLYIVQQELNSKSQKQKEKILVHLPHQSQTQNTYDSLCSQCKSLKMQIQELQLNVQLVQEQKGLLQDEIGALQEQKFCLNSTENQLKIKIQELNEEIDCLRQENERYAQEFEFICNNQALRRQEYPQKTSQQYLQHQETQINQIGSSEVKQIMNHDNGSKKRWSSPQMHLSLTANESAQKIGQHLTGSLAEEQNAQLRNSLKMFEEQLQEQELTIHQLEQRVSKLMHEKEILLQSNKELAIIKKQNQQNQTLQGNYKIRINELEAAVSKFQEQNSSYVLKSKKQLNSSLMIQKQQQIQGLERQHQSMSESLQQLTYSYQSLQSSFAQLQKNKLNQVQNLKIQHHDSNKKLTAQLEAAQKIIEETKKMSQANQVELRSRGQQIQHLIDQTNKITQENKSLKTRQIQQIPTKTIQNNFASKTSLQTTVTQLQSILEELKLSKKSDLNYQEKTFTQLLPLLSTKIDSLSPNQEDQSMRKKVFKQLQKIKVNIMKGSQSNNINGTLPRVNQTASQSAVGFKTFAQKSAMLSYLKPLEQLVKNG